MTEVTRSKIGVIRYSIGRMWMALTGWKVIGEVPSGSKFVLVGAPHTSNWDFPFAIAAFFVYRIKIHWMGKDSLFRWPYGWLFRLLGGIPIDRSHHQGVVNQVADTFKHRDELIIVIAAKGTRKKTEYWKSGFYWIAHSAQVPILCGYLDYKNKKTCIGLSFMPSGDVKQDMEKIRAFFGELHGKRPGLEDNIRLSEESPDV